MSRSLTMMRMHPKLPNCVPSTLPTSPFPTSSHIGVAVPAQRAPLLLRLGLSYPHTCAACILAQLPSTTYGDLSLRHRLLPHDVPLCRCRLFRLRILRVARIAATSYISPLVPVATLPPLPQLQPFRRCCCFCCLCLAVSLCWIDTWRSCAGRWRLGRACASFADGFLSLRGLHSLTYIGLVSYFTSSAPCFVYSPIYSFPL
ncbi:hypothetical protein K438DRAFT_1826065, partial [Mycena galopus ATCC 62051]